MGSCARDTEMAEGAAGKSLKCAGGGSDAVAGDGRGASQEARGDERVARGVFITFEGGDGSGKTTHINRLAETLESHGEEVVCVREPGGTKIGESVREILLDPQNTQMSSECELLLYVAARAQIVNEVIAPALARGAVVLCDRFTDSTLAYQGFGRGLDCEFIESANAFAQAGVTPDRTILLTCGGADVSLTRAIERDEDGEHEQTEVDRMELAGANFHDAVNSAYLTLAKKYPQRIRVIDSTQPKDETAAQIRHALCDLFPWMS